MAGLIGVDYSALLILPISAIIAFTTTVAGAIGGHPAPRLIWPFAISILVVALMSLTLPGLSVLGLWCFALLQLAVAAAIGTVIGGLIARAIIAAISSRKRS